MGFAHGSCESAGQTGKKLLLGTAMSSRPQPSTRLWLILDLPPQNVSQQPTIETRPLQVYLSPLFEQTQFMQGMKGGECLEFARKLLGLPPLWRHAKDMPVNFAYPVPGHSLAKLRYANGRYHTVAVTGVVGDSFSYVGSNMNGDGLIDTGQTYKINDPRVLGFYVPNLTLASR